MVILYILIYDFFPRYGVHYSNSHSLSRYMPVMDSASCCWRGLLSFRSSICCRIHDDLCNEDTNMHKLVAFMQKERIREIWKRIHTLTDNAPQWGSSTLETIGSPCYCSRSVQGHTWLMFTRGKEREREIERRNGSLFLENIEWVSKWWSGKKQYSSYLSFQVHWLSLSEVRIEWKKHPSIDQQIFSQRIIIESIIGKAEICLIETF